MPKNSFDERAEKFQKIGKSLTRRVTIPIILFVVGLVFFPFGILLWVIALGMTMNSGE